MVSELGMEVNQLILFLVSTRIEALQSINWCLMKGLALLYQAVYTLMPTWFLQHHLLYV